MSDRTPLTPLEPWIASKIGHGGRRLSPEALRSYQLTRLNETLARVQTHSHFYRELLGKPDIRLTALEDLADLPFTTAEDLKKAPLGFVCVSQNEVERIVTLPTSGTTGPPKRIYFTLRDQELTRDFFHRGMSTLVEAGDRVLILLPGSLPGSVGKLLKEGLARVGVDGIPHGPVTDPRHTLGVIKSERVTALVGIPVQVFWLARLAVTARSAHRVNLKSVLLSTDRVPHIVAETIERTWDCDIYNHYGTTEMGLGGGVDCQAKCGYHLREADLFFEIIDPATGLPMPEGECGEVVFTTLTRAAMPLIRYRTGDLSRFIPGPCPCGTVLRRMAHIHERMSDGATLPGGEILRQRDFDEALLKIDGLADFRVLFAQEGDRAIFVVRIRPFEAGPALDKNAVLRALGAMPVFSAYQAREQISIRVLDWDDREPVTSGTAKRRIVNLKEISG